MKQKIGFFVLLLISVILVVLFLLWTLEQGYPRRNQNTHWIRSPEIHFFQHSKHNAATPGPRTMDKFQQREHIMRRRLDHIQTMCENSSDVSYWKKVIPRGMVWQYKDLNYCIVPKVACTYWKRIIRFMSGDYPNRSDIVQPSDIDRHFVHFGQHPNIQLFYINNRKLQTNMTDKAFMFTRDPYSRLWSAYLDKIFLPEFWRVGNALGLVNAYSDEKDYKCASGLSFKDFLTYITRIWPKRLNDHWEPIHLLCSPCHVQYAAIGKLETFTDDAGYVLEKFDIHVNQTVPNSTNVLDEIKTLTTYNFNLERVMPPDCFYRTDVARRLWKVFQYNGYIDRLTPFPTKAFEDADFELHPTETFMDIATKTINSQTSDVKSQRRTMMLEAYAEIPQELLDKIKTIYKYDFELFGYDKDLFKI